MIPNRIRWIHILHDRALDILTDSSGLLAICTMPSNIEVERFEHEHFLAPLFRPVQRRFQCVQRVLVVSMTIIRAGIAPLIHIFVGPAGYRMTMPAGH